MLRVVSGCTFQVFCRARGQATLICGSPFPSLDDRTGVVTLRAGLYHVTAMSLTNSYDLANPTIIPTSLSPPAGYARLGNEVKGLYLQVNANGSVWHVNARITIQRL
jgi:hypothetical protein